MPDKFTVDMIIEPKFSYDTTTSNVHVLTWTVDTPHEVTLLYEQVADHFRIIWQNPNFRFLNTQTFDDGTTYTNLNQRLRFIVSLDLSSGGINDSRFICIPLESGALYEDSVWNNTPDIKDTDYPTLSIGNLSGATQADSDYEYLRIYNDLLVGDVNSSEDAEQLLQQMPMIFEAIPDALVPREIGVDTPVSSAIQQIANDVRTGAGIQDEAILQRHIRASFGLDTASTDAYTVDIEGARYTAGAVVSFKAVTANTGAATLNINGLGAKPIIKSVSTALATNDILADMICMCVYDGTSFVLMNPRVL